MQSTKPNRPSVLDLLPPLVRHLRDSEVLKMLQEEEPESVGQVVPQWPPKGHDITRPQGFMGKICTGIGPGGRPVEWPPRSESPSENQINDAPNMTTMYPSGFKYKDQAPLGNSFAKVVMSQPAFKISQPMKQRGDDKWPPKGAFEPIQTEVRQLIKPKKAQKDYSKFFAQNALPHNYAAYRPPPGTQHREGDKDEEEDEEEEEEEEEEESGVTNM